MLTSGCLAKLLLGNPIKHHALHRAATHRGPHVALEALPVCAQIFRSLLVERVTSIRLEEQKLQSYYDRIQVQNGLPVLAQDVEANLALEVDIRVVDLLAALHLGRLMGKVGRDVEREAELATAVHALVRLDVEDEAQDVIRIGEFSPHRRAQGKLAQICGITRQREPRERDQRPGRRTEEITPFCTRNCAAVTFFFLPPAAPSAFSAFCCSFFYPGCQSSSSVCPRPGSHTMDHIFSILALTRWSQSELGVVAGGGDRGDGLGVGRGAEELGNAVGPEVEA